MIRLDDVTLRRGTEPLLEHADLTVHAGQKIGLIGANGLGKSSLFALLQGRRGPIAPGRGIAVSGMRRFGRKLRL